VVRELLSSVVMKEQTPDTSDTRADGSNAVLRTAHSWPVLWVSLLLLIALTGAAYLSMAKGSVTRNDITNAANRDAAPGTPVVATRAYRGNIGVYIAGLGSVTPLYTVTVKTRVDGQLMAVHYKEGDTMQQGAPLVEIDSRPYEAQLNQYGGQLKRDQALLENAKVDLDRYTTLMKTKAVPEQQYATQIATVAQDEGQVETDQGLIEATKLNIAYCHITAPITGLVGLRLVDPGNYVQASAGTPLLVITQIQPISIIFPIAEDQLPQVLAQRRTGQTLVVEGWDRDQLHRLAAGTLETIDNQIDQTTGTVRLRANFANHDNALFPNQFVYVRLLLQEKKGVILIPTAAVQRTANRTYVYLVKPDSSVSVRDIQTGTTDGEKTEVTKGLAAGDELVITGVDRLTEGTKVEAQLQDDSSAGKTGRAK